MDDVTTITALKAKVATPGTFVNLLGYHAAGDGGGGTFKAILIDDFTSGALVAPGATTSSRTFSNVKWKYGIERQEPRLGHYADQLKFTGGAVWTKNNKWRGPGDENNEFTGDAAIGVTNGEKAYVVPKVEGWRVIPTYGGWDGTWIWERVIENGTVYPEYFGAKASYTLGDYTTEGNDCTAAIQACMDSPFAVQFGGGAFYQSGTVYIKSLKTIIGVGAENATLEYYRTRAPIVERDKHWSCIWTDQNINLWSVQTNCHIEKFHFDVSRTVNGVYDKALLNYDMSFPNWGSSVYFCSFKGNKTTTNSYAGKGGIGIRWNSDDADTTFSRRNGGPNTGGSIYGFTTQKLNFLDLARGVRLDDDKINAVSPETGLLIYTNCNGLHVDACYIDCKIGAELLHGAFHKITGEYFQDGFCLPYEERDFPCFRLHAGTFVDIGNGDNRHTLPTVNDSVALGGTITYPQNHFSAYIYETKGNVSYSGRSIRDYEAGTILLGTPKYAMDNGEFINLDNQEGHLGWDRSSAAGFSKVSHWVDNGLLLADKKATVTVSTLRATVGFNFQTATDELRNVLPQATGVTVSQFNGLWDIKDILIPTISFGAGSNVDLDFVEITIKNPMDSQNFVNRMQELIVDLLVGCKAIQVITRQGDGTIRSNLTSDTSTVSNTRRSLRFPLSPTFSVNKLIIRFIGSTGVNTVFRSLHSNSAFLVDYPFLPTQGGTLKGPLTFAPSLGLAPLTKRTTLVLSSSQLLASFSSGPRNIVPTGWVDIRGVDVRVTSGTVNYKAGDCLDFFQGSKLKPVFSIPLDKLPRNGNRQSIPLLNDNERLPGSGLSCQARVSNPTVGNKAITVVVDYVDS